MYEPKSVPPISTSLFARRLLRHAGYGGVLIVVSLLLGTAGFKHWAGQDSLTAFENSAMSLGGMGPVGEADKYRDSGKWFAAFFALYAGLVLLVVAGVLIAPVFHRILHRFHWDEAKR